MVRKRQAIKKNGKSENKRNKLVQIHNKISKRETGMTFTVMDK